MSAKQNINGQSKKTGVERSPAGPASSGNKKTGDQPLATLPAYEWVEEISEEKFKEIFDFVSRTFPLEKFLGFKTHNRNFHKPTFHQATYGFIMAMKEFHREDYSPKPFWEKDPRWDTVYVTENIITKALEGLADPDIWGGETPKNLEDNASVEEIVSAAVFEAFSLALGQVQQFCNAFIMYPDEEEYPRKYLPQ